MYDPHNNPVKGAVSYLLLIILFTVAFGLFYLLSDPFKSKVDILFEKTTEWTPENINKYPVEYLSWTISEIEKGDADIAAQIFSSETRLNKINRERDVSLLKAKKYQILLDDLKSLYMQNDSLDDFIVDYNGIKLTKNELKEKIVSANSEIIFNNQKIEKNDVYIAKMTTNLTFLKNKSKEASSLKRSVLNELELAKTKKIVDDIDGIGDRLSSIQINIDSLNSGFEKFSIDDLVDSNQSSQVDYEFSRIMGN